MVTASHEERGPTSPDRIASSAETAERKRNAARHLPSEYRSGVGVMLLNSCNEVLVGRRRTVEGESWQMPQGGIDHGENPRGAVYRELKEEIGTDNVEILAESKDWLHYDLPADLLGKVWGGRWRGQRHKWFVARFKGIDAEINIDTAHPEFSDWKWVAVDELPTIIVAFKRSVYLAVIEEFRAVIGRPMRRQP